MNLFGGFPAQDKRADAVVTGAGSGIGAAFGLELAARGGRVVCSDINENAARPPPPRRSSPAGGLGLRCFRIEDVHALAEHLQARRAAHTGDQQRRCRRRWAHRSRCQPGRLELGARGFNLWGPNPWPMAVDMDVVLGPPIRCVHVPGVRHPVSSTDAGVSFRRLHGSCARCTRDGSFFGLMTAT